MTKLAATILAGLAVGALSILAAAPTPAARCQDAGYADALHILQPDGKTREWMCYTLPSDDLTTTYRSRYLREI